MSDNQPPVRVGLCEFLKKSVGCQFIIPVYQRNYTWTAKKEVKKYFDDLKSILLEEYKKHFMGILIYLDTPIDYSTREFSVIDGQQRLTTTFLFLYAIKQLMVEKNFISDAKRVEDCYLINRYVPDNMKLKLKPLVSDDEVYKKIIEDKIDEITENQKKSSNVYKNYTYILDRLNELLQEYDFSKILMALNKLYVVCIPVTIEDSPQKIFESINSTGLKLTAADLIRNYILMDVNSEIQEKYYNCYWKKIEENLDNDSKKLELFFRMFLACKLQDLPNINAVYSNFEEWCSAEIANGNTKEDLLQEIVKYSKFYNCLYYKDIANVDINIREAIIDFRNNLTDMPAPLLMEIYNLYDKQNAVSAKQFNEIINSINIYLIRRSLCALDTSDITRLFPTISKDVLNECAGDYKNIVNIVNKNLVNKQRGKSSAMPTDDEIKSYLYSANVYKNRKTLKIVFDKLETYQNSAPVDLTKLSIEHLMPQTSTKEWLDVLAIDNETYEKNLHRLGNLTLATRVDNSKMKNKPWDYKKAILADTSHLIMNQHILQNDKWSIDDIDKRTIDLIEQIILCYPYFSAPEDLMVKYDIFLKVNDAYASAILYEEDGSVEIQEGSKITKYSEDTSEWIVNLFSKLKEDAILAETDDGAIFIKSYTLPAKRKNSSSLSTAAGLILGGNRNGWDYWKDIYGTPLNKNKALKKKFNAEK